MEDYVSKLYQQLTNQRKNLGTGKHYKGSIDSMGGIDTATQYMASLLNRSGIRDLSEIGEKVERVPQYAPKQNYYFTEDDIQKFNKLASSNRFGEEFVPTDDGSGYYRPKDPPVDEAVDVDGKKYFVKYGYNYYGDTGDRYGYLVPAEQTGTQINKTLINKRTGEQLKQGHDASYIYAATQNSYLDGEQADADYTIGGSFAGGNTSLKVRLVDGVPVFYSTAGPSSSDISPGMISAGLGIASLMFPGIGTAIGGAITGSLGIAASAAVNAAIGTGVLTTIASGGDVKKGVISGLTAYVAPAVASEIGKAAGNIFDSPVGAKMFANMSAAAMRTAALGGNSDAIEKAVLGTATAEMFNVVASQIPGFNDIQDKATKAAISSSIQAALSTPGDLSQKAQAAMLQGSITKGLSELEVDGKKFTELSSTQQNIARQALTSALTGQPLNDKAILNAALSGASKDVQAAIKAEQKAGVEPTPAPPLDDDVGFAVGPEFTAPGAAPPDAVLTAEAPSAGPMPSGPTAPRADSGFTPGMGGITDVLSPTGEIAQLGGDGFGQEITAPESYRPPVTEYASAATSDVPAQDISIGKLPESMRPRDGETVTDATYGPEGEVRVTMVGKRPDGSEYSYTAVQDPEDQSVFYETASNVEAGQPGATRVSDSRPELTEKSEVDKFIDGIPESNNLPGTAEGNVDDLEATADYTDAITNALAGLDFATDEDIQNIINLTLQDRPNLTEEQVSSIVGGHLDQFDIPTDVDIQSIVNESIKTADLAKKADVTDAITNALAGLDFANEEDVKKAIDAALEANPSLTSNQVSGLIKDELEKNNLATDADVKKLAGDIADVQEGIAGLGLDYADKLATAVDSITQKVNEFESTGATRDEALSAALDNVASDLGLAREEFLKQLGETETTLGDRIAKSETAFAEQIGGLQTDLVAKISALEEAGLSRDDAIKQSISSLAGELGETETSLLQKLGTTESNLKTQLEGVTTEFGKQLGDIQEQIAGQGLEYATKLSTAVGDINERMTEFESIGATRDEALQAAIDNVAESLGVTSESLLEQLNLNKKELQGQIEQANLDYAKQVAGLGTDITGVKTGLETLGAKVGEQVGGLGTKVAGIEQTLAQQPEQWAKLFSDMQKGFGTQISGLQSQLARQTAQQQAAQKAAQQAAMAPKFETFYANIPGYKPFDLRQFSSDFFDEE